MSWRSTVLIIALTSISACISLTENSARQPANIVDPTTSPAQAFAIVHQIATGPRCTNCHMGELPEVLAGTEQKYHPMDIQRKFSRLGGACATCHQNQNFTTPHMPPGAVGWRMPSPIKAYDASITPADLCRLWTGKNNIFEEGPQEGQPRTPQDLLVHITTDPLVRWSFDPGPGREPARSGAGGYEYFIANFKLWVDGGAVCPER